MIDGSNPPNQLGDVASFPSLTRFQASPVGKDISSCPFSWSSAVRFVTRKHGGHVCADKILPFVLPGL